MPAAKLTLTTFLTLDGVMQAPGGPDEDRSGDFRHGGWVVPHFDDDLGRFIDGVFENADAFLLGRRTYQIFAAHWPHFADSDDPVASKLNRLPKHVASRTLKQVEWNNSSLVRGDVAKEVGELKRRYSRELQVHGSGDLAQTLLENDLIDQLNLLVFPVALGTGKRLFGSGTVPAAMSLVDSRTSSTGVLITTYRRTGKPTYGSFALEQVADQ